MKLETDPAHSWERAPDRPTSDHKLGVGHLIDSPIKVACNGEGQFSKNKIKLLSPEQAG